jgi:hypothetical protein
MNNYEESESDKKAYEVYRGTFMANNNGVDPEDMEKLLPWVYLAILLFGLYVYLFEKV